MYIRLKWNLFWAASPTTGCCVLDRGGRSRCTRGIAPVGSGWLRHQFHLQVDSGRGGRRLLCRLKRKSKQYNALEIGVTQKLLPWHKCTCSLTHPFSQCLAAPCLVFLESWFLAVCPSSAKAHSDHATAVAGRARSLTFVMLASSCWFLLRISTSSSSVVGWRTSARLSGAGGSSRLEEAVLIELIADLMRGCNGKVDTVICLSNCKGTAHNFL